VKVTNRGDGPFPPAGQPVIFEFVVHHPNGRMVKRRYPPQTPGQLAVGKTFSFAPVDVAVEETGYMHLTMTLCYPNIGVMPLRILGLDDWEAGLTHETKMGLVTAPDYNQDTTSPISSRWADERSALYTRWGLWLAAIGLLSSTALSYVTLAHENHWWPFG
jgi:hypothetical protein